MNIFVLIRAALGILFIVSGGEKLLSPVENFVYVIEGYQILPLFLAKLAAFVFPWVEVMAGVFVLGGLWLRYSLGMLMAVSLTLMGIVGQAILRRLPLDNCGCFGELIHLPLKGVILVDVTILALSFLCFRNVAKASVCSLDEAYAEKK